MEKSQAETEIALIKKIMDDSRRIACDDGKDYIIWGVLVLVGLIGTYLSIVWKTYNYIGWIWIITMGGGWIFVMASHWRKDSKEKVRTFAGKVLAVLWISCGIAMSLIGFVAAAARAIGPWSISPMISIVLGVAYAVSGMIYGNRWIQSLAAGWWAGAVVMFIWPGSYTLLLFAAMMVLFQITPGVVLYIKWKKELQLRSNG
jgi:hypothetical protein